MNQLKSLSLLAALALAVSARAADKTFIDYFQPTPITSGLTTNAWGAPDILPREPQNGLEDSSLKDLPLSATKVDAAQRWYYWDGQIIKSPENGKYYLFASGWDEARGHGGWGGSSAVYAVSENLFGPYVDKGLLWTNVINGVAGRGHNVTALTLPDGRYAVLISETRPGCVYIAKSLDGPWEFQGPLTFSTNEFFSGNVRRLSSNMSIMVRPDGHFEIVQRSGLVLLSTNGVMGPYAVQGPSAYALVPELNPMHTLEDPVVWFSGGLYHIVVNDWSTRKAYHITSADGIRDWKFQGLAYDPRRDMVRYAGGTVNHWHKVERPGVYLENGHVMAITLAAIDIPKEEDRGNEPHGSKVIVIPFDGAALDRDLQGVAH